MTESKGGSRAAWTRALVVGTMLSGAIVAAPLAGAKADTQSEIEALKRENAELREMVKSLSQDVKILQKTVSQTGEAAAKAAESPKAPDKMVTSGKSDVQLVISGQVDRELLYVDDGDQSQVFNADNKTSSSRLNLTGKAKLDDDITAGATIEVELKSNDSGSVTMSQETEANSGVALTERKVEVFAESKTLGKLYMGQGPQATDGVSENDLSGTSVVSSASFGVDQGASVFFRRAGTNASSGFRPRDLFDDFDSGRRDRIRYDTPSLAGFVGAISYSDNDIYDYALWYGGDFNGWKVAAAVGYEDANTQATGFSVLNGSAAVLAPFGTSLQGGYAEKDFETVGRNTNDFWWIKLGQQFADLISLGSTSFSFAYAEQSDQGVNDSDGAWWNLAAVQAVTKVSTEIFFSLGQYDAEIPNIPTDEMFIGVLGARLKF